MSIYISSTSEVVASFQGDVMVGDLVEFNNGGMAIASATNKELCGVCVTSRAGVVGVKIKGVVTISYTGTAPSLGHTPLVSSSNNEIKTGTTGTKYLVLDVDTIKSTATILL